MEEATLYLYKDSGLVAIRDMTMAVWDEVLTETNKDFILSASEYLGEYDDFKIVIEGAYIESDFNAARNIAKSTNWAKTKKKKAKGKDKEESEKEEGETN